MLKVVGTIKLNKRMSNSGKPYYTTAIFQGKDYKSGDNLYINGFVSFKDRDASFNDGDIIRIKGMINLAKSNYLVNRKGEAGVDLSLFVQEIGGVAQVNPSYEAEYEYDYEDKDNTSEEEGVSIMSEGDLPF